MGTIVMFGLMILIVLALLGGLKRKDKPEKLQARQEKELLRLAQRRKGRVSVTDAAAGTSLTTDEAERMLEEMARKGHATLQVEDSGALVYEFYGISAETQPVESDPATTASIEKTPEKPASDPAAKLGDRSGSGNKLVENVKIASSAYKNWLPKLLERLDDFSAYSDEMTLQRFKPIVRQEIATYQEYEQQGRATKGDMPETQFAAKMILYFSSGPMLNILKAVLEEIEFWEEHKDEVDAATVLETVRKLLTEEASPS